MAAIDPQRVTEFLERANKSTSAKEKGDSFEELLCYLFMSVPGISIAERNRKNVANTEEIDIAFWNDRSALPFLPWIVLVECKNLSEPVGSSDVSWFVTKIRNRGQSFGVLFAANGVTGDGDGMYGWSELRMALRDGI